MFKPIDVSNGKSETRLGWDNLPPDQKLGYLYEWIEGLNEFVNILSQRVDGLETRLNQVERKNSDEAD